MFCLDCRYQDIAKLALDVRQKKDLAAAKLQSKGKRSGQDADVMVQIAQELYRVVLFAVFMAQTFVVGHIPFLGTFTFMSYTHKSFDEHLSAVLSWLLSTVR